MTTVLLPRPLLGCNLSWWTRPNVRLHTYPGTLRRVRARGLQAPVGSLYSLGTAVRAVPFRCTWTDFVVRTEGFS